MAQSINDAAAGVGGVLGKVGAEQLRGFADRIKHLTEQRASINEDMAEVFNEASEAGFDRKVLRKAVKRVMSDPDKLRAEEEMVDSYVDAIQPDLFTRRPGGGSQAEGDTRAAA